MMHRFLCCSDTRGKAPPPLDENGATAWLHAGGVYDGWSKPIAEPLDPLQDLPQADLTGWETCLGVAAWLRLAIPVFAVRGNQDINDLHGFFWKCDDLSGSVRRLAGNLLIAGIGWSGEQISDLPTEADLRHVCDVVAREVLRQGQLADRLIVLSHYPASANSGDRGYGSLHELVFDLGPIALIAGHIPEWFGRSEQMDVLGGRTLVVHPGPEGGLLHIDASNGSALWQPARIRRAG